MATGSPKPAKEFKVTSVTDLGAGKLKFEMRDGDGVPCFTEVKPRPDQNVWSEGNFLLIDSKGILSKFAMRDAHLAVSCAMSLMWADPLAGIDHPEPETFGEAVDRITIKTKAETRAEAKRLERENAKAIQLVVMSDGILAILKDDGTVWKRTRNTRGDWCWEELR